MNAELEALARHCGIALSYEDVDGRIRRASNKAVRRTLAALGFDSSGRTKTEAPPVPLSTELSGDLRPPRGVRCFMPGWLDHGQAWGITAQLYQLRSKRNWGIGDFSDLAQMARHAAGLGADFLGLNPLHALFSASPDRISPFSPSNRRFLNPIYIALDAVPGIDMRSVESEALTRVRSADLVDYAVVSRIKLEALRAAWMMWPERGPDEGVFSRSAFERFREEEGRALERHAVFEALSMWMVEAGHGASWQNWPKPYREPESKAVAAFARENAPDIGFHAWLQWLADVQLGQAQHAAREAGMRIGLYLDFAVGESPDGSAAWADPHLTVPELRIGAPPDLYNEVGQDWGLAPFSPEALRQGGVAAYGDVMARVMRHAGALRIDHAMGLYRLYVISSGLEARDGVYIHMPLGAILSTLSDLSHRLRTIVIGEDLGTVPEGFRRVMTQCEIQSYRVLYFERERGRLRAPARYPRKALACLSTHDLATLEGWWSGEDIALRRRLEFIGDATLRTQIDERETDRAALIAALRRAHLLASSGRTRTDRLDSDLAAAIHAHLARAPSRLFAVRLEDLAGEHAPVNVPGTTNEYPNWRHKLSVSTETLMASDRFLRITQAVAAQRPKRP